MKPRILLILSFVMLLSACGGGAGVDERIAALDDSRWQIRAANAEALGREGAHEAIPALQELLADRSSEVRCAAVIGLRLLEADEARTDFRRLALRGGDRLVRVQALFGIAAVGDETDFDTLVSAQSRGNPRRVRRAARRVMESLMDDEQIIGALWEDLRSESSVDRQGGARRAALLDRPAMRGWELEFLDDDDLAVRIAAWQTFVERPRPRDLDRMLEGLTDQRSGVRRQAISGLQKLKAPGLVDLLRERIVSDENSRVRNAAAKALASELGVDGSVIPALWRYERIHDRLDVQPDGEVRLTRTVRVRIEETAEPIDEFPIFMPRAFPVPESVHDADGGELDFDLDRNDQERELVIEVPDLRAGDSIEVVVQASSRRPLKRDGRNVLVAYSPAPLAAPIDRLEVEVVAPSSASTPLAPRPRDATHGASPEGTSSVSWERTDLDHRSVERLEVVAGLDELEVQPAWIPPNHYTRQGHLRLLALLAVVAVAILSALALRARRRQISAYAVVTAIMVTGAFFLLTPALYEDNFSYFASASSIVIDGDLDCREESYELNRHNTRASKIGAGLDPMFGPLSRLPALFAADVTTRIVNLAGFRHGRNGFSFPYYFLTSASDFFMVLLGCLACVSLVRRRIGREYAAPATLAVLLGTHLGLMAYAWTASSFQPSVFLFAVFLDLWDRTRDRRGPIVWAAGGLLIGLLCITRTMNMSFCLVPLLDWCWVAVGLAWRKEPARLARHVGMGFVFTAALVVGYAPQLLLQCLVDHVWIIDSYGVGSGRFTNFARNVGELFIRGELGDDYYWTGLLTATPVIGLATLGLIPLIRRDPRLGLILVVTLALQVLVITSYEVSSGYFTFGSPYFVPSSAIFCLGLAALLRTVRECLPRVVGPVLAAVVLVPAALRGAWCMLRELADEQVGDWESTMSTVEVLSQMWMPGRKLNEGLLSASSEFGVLARETVGGLRSGNIGDIATALFWFSFILVPVLVAWPMARRARSALSALPATTRRRAALTVAAVAIVSGYGFLYFVGWSTDVDYAHKRKKWAEGESRIAPKMLEDGDDYDWSPSCPNGSVRFAVVTFLEGATDLVEGEEVALVVVSGENGKQEWSLRAGIDTADLYIDRPELRETRGHRPPPDRVAWTWRVPDDSSRFYTARTYVSTFELSEPMESVELEIEARLPKGRLGVALITAEEAKIGRLRYHHRWRDERW